MNQHGCNGLVVLLTFMASAGFGIVIFTRGFLLTRFVLTIKSPSDARSEAVFNKTIVLVVDALRYDFVKQHSDANASTSLYHNQMQHLQHLLKNQADRTKLYRFMADPPTTTMQRLKALMTGSLPTFVDAGSNFASPEIVEDNLLDQLIAHNKSIVFMGDDTWLSLFPGRFIRSFPYPSFNVHDLNTVDNGVKQHLLPELVKSDWSLLIGHFLGVDHCGHRYGPNHPAMREKLREIDDTIRKVSDQLDNDTLLVVFGDHGMTQAGDHGGDSKDELAAALIVHSRRPFTDALSLQVSDEVSQIDIVPTLSLLLGIPIPFSNLGTAIPELLLVGPNQTEFLIKSLSQTHRQISEYLQAYIRGSNDFPLSTLTRLEEIARQIALHTAQGRSAPQQIARYLQYAQLAKEMCQEIWAKFDVTVIVIGLLHTVFSLILFLGVVSSWISFAIMSQFMLTLTSLVLLYVHMPELDTVATLTMSFILICVVSSSRTSPHSVSVHDLIFFVGASLRMIASFSNSMVVSEDRVYFYLAQSLLWFVWIRFELARLPQGANQKAKEKLRQLSDICVHPAFLLTLLMSVLLLISSYFVACREEKAECKPTLFGVSLGSLPSSMQAYINIRFWCYSVPCTVFLVFATRRILRVRGNLNGTSMVTLFSTYLLPLLAGILCLHWVMGASALVHKLPEWQQVFLPRGVYILFLLMIVTVALDPLAIHVSGSNSTPFRGAAVSSVFRYIRSAWGDSGSQKPVVYGLSSAYSAPYLLAMSVSVLLLMMLHGDGMVAPLVLAFCCQLAFLDLAKIYGSNIDISSLVILWGLLSNHFFYAFGQQPTITGLRWEAAFQGFVKDHDNYVVPTILLLLVTFGSQFLFSLSIPLLIIAPTNCNTFYHSLITSAEQVRTGKGEISTFEATVAPQNVLLQLLSLHVLNHLGKVCASMTAAFLLRRHLMVWKIFAPAFVFEAVAFFVICFTVSVTYLFFTRITFAVNKFTQIFELSHVD